MQKLTISQTFARPVLTLWSDSNFSGRALHFRGNLGVRSLSVFDFNDVLSSLRFTGNSRSTLVLFQDDNYQGSRIVFRGPVSISFLSNFNDTASSFIISRDRLSNSDIDRIQSNRRAPNSFGEVLPNGSVTSRGRKPVRKAPLRKPVLRKAVLKK
ncbi:hypothetical protein D3C73_1101420 [compost metagenome]